MKEFTYTAAMREILKSILSPIGDSIHFNNEGQLFVGPDYTDRIICFEDVTSSSRDICPQLWSISIKVIEPERLETETTLAFYMKRIIGFIERSSIVDLIGFAIDEREKRIQLLVANDLVITTTSEDNWINWREKVSTHFPHLDMVGSNTNYFG